MSVNEGGRPGGQDSCAFADWTRKHPGLALVIGLAAFLLVVVPPLIIVPVAGRIAGAVSTSQDAARSLAAFGDKMLTDGDAASAAAAYTRALGLDRSPAIEQKLLALRLKTLAENPDMLDARGLDDLNFDRKWLMDQKPADYGAISLAIAGHIALARGDVDSAEREFQRSAEFKGSSGPARLGLGMVALARGDAKKARDEFAAAAAAMPTSVYAQLTYGDLASADEADKAEAAYAASLKVRDTSRAHRGLAKLLVVRKDLQGAVNELRRAVAADPKDADALVMMGQLLASAGALDDAEKALRAALAIGPNLAAAETLTGLLIGKKQYDEAIAIGQSYFQRNQVSPILFLNVARATEASGQQAQALDAYRGCAEYVKGLGQQIDPELAKQILAETEAGIKRLAGEPPPPPPAEKAK
jgi:tetratricopeptide (TPR) repeat protein